jgi:5-(carboxyamino)imidazole ribonucleotide synthase
MILPPARLGILGSGQLGQMFTQEATKMGYSVVVYSPDSNSPASKAGATEISSSYTDFVSLEKFLDSVQAVSFEFENIPEDCLKFLLKYESKKGKGFFSPSPSSIYIAQNRIREKEHFRLHNLPTVLFLPILTGSEDFSEFPFPAILKTNRWGYDGKGQTKFENKESLTSFLQKNPPSKDSEYILEAMFPFEKEISVIYARNSEGVEFIFPPARNLHKNHILDITEFPAQLTESVHDAAVSMASVLGRSMNYEGVLGVEFFVSGDLIVVNEFAPRPHNSGHFTQDGSHISQFGLQLRILTGQNLPAENQIQPTIMKNILGNSFSESIQLAMNLVSQDSRYHLHLYQKEEPKPGRKMGHLNFLGLPQELEKTYFRI